MCMLFVFFHFIICGSRHFGENNLYIRPSQTWQYTQFLSLIIVDELAHCKVERVIIQESTCNNESWTHFFVSEVVKAAVMSEHKPPLPPALEQTGLGALVQIAPTGRPGGVRGAADVRANSQSQQIGSFWDAKERNHKSPKCLNCFFIMHPLFVNDFG